MVGEQGRLFVVVGPGLVAGRLSGMNSREWYRRLVARLSGGIVGEVTFCALTELFLEGFVVGVLALDGW